MASSFLLPLKSHTAAVMALPLRLSRCNRTTLASPRLSRLSSLSSSSNGGGGGGGGGENDKNPPPPPPPSSYLSDVKASLCQSPLSPPQKPPTAAELLRKKLSEFRRRSAVPSQGSSSPPPVSFKKGIYDGKLIGKPAEDAATDTKTPCFNSIRESLLQSSQKAALPQTQDLSQEGP
ncbi:hypothetical protein MRB53_035555 [Persea americana]|uniref:Uncharacterized protein n=1 Tax=Persea americana TaxID=3435 RepID=A0ACC2K5L6_PERAE|nr:hypothetical protein MRB53_035555 [Persea americana]